METYIPNSFAKKKYQIALNREIISVMVIISLMPPRIIRELVQDPRSPHFLPKIAPSHSFGIVSINLN